MERVFKLEVSTVSLTEPHRRGGEIIEIGGMEDTRRTWSTESVKLGSYGLIETEAARISFVGVYTKSSVNVTAIIFVFLWNSIQ